MDTKNEISTRTFGEEESGTVWKLVLIIIGIILIIVLMLFLLRRFIQGGFYNKKNSIEGKIVIVTGCNTGIGKETVKELAKRGAIIYMACRDPRKCEEARLEIIEKTKNSNIFNRTLDLASLSSIENFVAKFKEEQSKLDILINNAGVMAMPKGQTEDGFEMQMGVNHLGHFYLTNLLLDRLEAAAPSRVIVVSSHGYMLGRINRKDFMLNDSYSKFGAYCQSKLANILFTRHLAKKLQGTGITVNACHPGVVDTDISRQLVGGFTKRMFLPIRYFFFKTPRAGAQTSLKLALDPKLEERSGGYYSDCVKFPLLARAKDETMAEWLWVVSEWYTGMRKELPDEFSDVNEELLSTSE